MVTFMTYNLQDYGASQDEGEIERCARVHEVVRGCDPDVLAVQELIAEGQDAEVRAGQRLRELAAECGLCCELDDGQLALGMGNHRFHVGMLWRPGIAPAGGFRVYSGVNAWHALLVLNLDVGGPVPLRHASYHGPPFGRFRRADEAERVAAIMSRAGDPPGVVGGDWNAISADRVNPDWWRWGFREDEPDPVDYYDHDPYQPVLYDNSEWNPAYVHQTRWEVDGEGNWYWWADREPGQILTGAGLRDTAAAVAVPWQATTGHANSDPFPKRRIDRVHVTSGMVAALRGHEVADTATARNASDHLPVLVDYDPAAIAAISS